MKNVKTAVIQIALVPHSPRQKLFETPKEAIAELHNIVGSFEGRKVCPSIFNELSSQMSCLVFMLIEQGLITRGVPSIEVRQDTQMYGGPDVVRISFDAIHPEKWLCEAMGYDPSLSNAERFILELVE